MIPSEVLAAFSDAYRRRDSASEFGIPTGQRPLPRPRTHEHQPGSPRGSMPTTASRSAEADSVSGGLAPGRTPPVVPQVPVDKSSQPHPNIEF